MNEQSQSLKNWRTPFFSIWIGQALSLIGSQIGQFALVWWLTESTGSVRVLAMATLVAIVPSIIVGPFAGALIDRWDRRKVMLLADLFVALVSAWLAVLFLNDSMAIWHVYVAMLARGLGDTFHRPSMDASTTLMVPEKHLSRVAGINHTLHGFLNIAAPPLGALLLGFLPLHGIMTIDIITAMMAITPLLFTKIPRPSRIEADDEKKQNLWNDMGAGIRYILSWPGLFMIILLAMMLNLILNPAFSLLPLLVTEYFGGGALQLGWLESGWGIGMVLGGILLSIWGGFRRRILTSLMGIILGGLFITLFGLVPQNAFNLAIIALFFAGFTNPIINGPFHALIQASVTPQMQGRVFTLIRGLTTAMMPLGLALAGPIADQVGIRALYIGGGLVFTISGVGCLFIPAIVNLDLHPDKDTARCAPLKPVTVE